MAHIENGGKVARTIDDVNPLRRRIVEDIIDAILEEYDFDEERTVMMDYACGTGLISQQLAANCKEVVGVDSDDAMVSRYNEMARNQGLDTEEMRAVRATAGHAEAELEGKIFDVIVCTQAYHHFESINDVTKHLAKYLAPADGVLLVIDHIRQEQVPDADFEDTFHTHGGSRVYHPGGFSEDEIHQAFESAALEDFSFSAFTEFKKRGRTHEMFIARGIRQAT